MKKKQILFAAAGIIFLAGASAVTEYREAADVNRYGIAREAVGGAERTESIRYRIDGGEVQEISLDISPQVLSAEEADALLEAAKQEWEACFLGENDSAEYVNHDLYLPQSLSDGLIRAEYVPDQPMVIDETGALQAESIPKEGIVIRLETVFSYADYKLTDVRALHIFPPEKSSEAVLQEKIYEAAAKKENDSREEKSLILPTEIGGHTVVWETEKTMHWMLILMLGGAGLAALYLREKEQKKKEKKEREEQLLYEYPQMIEQICLLLGSGMTIRRAWERMVYTYQKQKEMNQIPDKLFANEMLLTEYEMRRGRGEGECYARFAGRIGLEPYRRFAAILTRNLAKGNDDIRRLLSDEAGQAMLMRKNTAIRLGEEASTKLLGPMLLMFLVILAAVLFPALENF